MSMQKTVGSLSLILFREQCLFLKVSESHRWLVFVKDVRLQDKAMQLDRKDAWGSLIWRKRNWTGSVSLALNSFCYIQRFQNLSNSNSIFSKFTDKRPRTSDLFSSTSQCLYRTNWFSDQRSLSFLSVQHGNSEGPIPYTVLQCFALDKNRERRPNKSLYCARVWMIVLLRKLQFTTMVLWLTILSSNDSQVTVYAYAGLLQMKTTQLPNNKCSIAIHIYGMQLLFKQWLPLIQSCARQVDGKPKSYSSTVLATKSSSRLWASYLKGQHRRIYMYLIIRNYYVQDYDRAKP